MSFFWGVVTVFCLIWYTSMVIFVGIRGFSDIFEMLKALKKPESNTNIKYNS